MTQSIVLQSGVVSEPVYVIKAPTVSTYPTAKVRSILDADEIEEITWFKN